MALGSLRSTCCPSASSFVATLELEALRDRVRAREDARLDRMRARHGLAVEAGESARFETSEHS